MLKHAIILTTHGTHMNHLAPYTTKDTYKHIAQLHLKICSNGDMTFDPIDWKWMPRPTTDCHTVSLHHEGMSSKAGRWASPAHFQIQASCRVQCGQSSGGSTLVECDVEFLMACKCPLFLQVWYQGGRRWFQQQSKQIQTHLQHHAKAHVIQIRAHRNAHNGPLQNHVVPPHSRLYRGSQQTL